MITFSKQRGLKRRNHRTIDEERKKSLGTARTDRTSQSWAMWCYELHRHKLNKHTAFGNWSSWKLLGNLATKWYNPKIIQHEASACAFFSQKKDPKRQGLRRNTSLRLRQTKQNMKKMLSSIARGLGHVGGARFWSSMASKPNLTLVTFRIFAAVLVAYMFNGQNPPSRIGMFRRMSWNVMKSTSTCGFCPSVLVSRFLCKKSKLPTVSPCALLWRGPWDLSICPHPETRNRSKIIVQGTWCIVAPQPTSNNKILWMKFHQQINETLSIVTIHKSTNVLFPNALVA